MSSVGLIWFVSTVFLFELKKKAGEQGNQFSRVRKKRAKQGMQSQEPKFSMQLCLKLAMWSIENMPTLSEPSFLHLQKEVTR